MTALNKKDYSRFLWIHRKTLIIFSVIILALRFILSIIKVMAIIINVMDLISFIAAFVLLEIIFMYSYKKDIEKLDGTKYYKK
ncbi:MULTISPECIES: hypothetical protein [Acidiplasma]|jgi:hypothetical protein|uniref:Uncharacterized protein n=2 Tax=Acidiplasma TaxID=507753 RepID=A0A0Q0VLE6_9ARCH|nr:MULTISPECIES: hypothetical protein [Acidiplasma]KJE48654.1 hypothetical protein TZ01_08405 [Acidiplasma sp. MBA-1]KPV46239.1 hypothetical protein SE19_06420 [Acidiplasma aeolicum]KQB33585.1 hypothetical protein AOG54_06810 [Acidiplasma aeolicum]KQB34263.1 hypothetical protein AOG55_01135 [Acidiplasma cupricumulans]WMT55413.1 MAG: hypothetical protein RE470_01925 [Acidiplasma sp.]